MSTQPPQPIPPEQRLALEQQARYNRIVRNLAIGGAIFCPLIIALPPRKLDFYTFSLAVGFYLSADHLVTEKTGLSLVSQFTPKKDLTMPTEKAREVQKMLREEREKGRRMLSGEHGVGETARGVNGSGDGGEEQGVLGKLWMGDEKAGWKERRLEEERKALEEGKSYTDLIVEQIWDVWNWDKKKGGDRSGEKKE